MFDRTYIDQIVVDALGLAAVAVLPLFPGPIGIPGAVEVDLEEILKDLVEVEAAVILGPRVSKITIVTAVQTAWTGLTRLRLRSRLPPRSLPRPFYGHMSANCHCDSLDGM
jgi:hypothetical protein